MSNQSRPTSNPRYCRATGAPSKPLTNAVSPCVAKAHDTDTRTAAPSMSMASSLKASNIAPASRWAPARWRLAPPRIELVETRPTRFARSADCRPTPWRTSSRRDRPRRERAPHRPQTASRHRRRRDLAQQLAAQKRRVAHDKIRLRPFRLARPSSFRIASRRSIESSLRRIGCGRL